MESYTLFISLADHNGLHLVLEDLSYLMSKTSTDNNAINNCTRRICQSRPYESFLKEISQKRNEFVSFVCIPSSLGRKSLHKRCGTCQVDVANTFYCWRDVSSSQSVFDVVRSLEMMQEHLLHTSHIDNSSTSDFEFLGDVVHHLADELPEKYSYQLDVVIISNNAEETDIVREHVHFFFALKRLENWHHAIFTLHAQEVKDISIGESWLNDIPIKIQKYTPVDMHKHQCWWKGNVQLVMRKNLECFTLHSCQLLCPSDSCADLITILHGISRETSSVGDDETVISDENLFIASQLNLLTLVRNEDLPLHMLLPVRLKLFSESGEFSLFDIAATVKDFYFVASLRWDKRPRKVNNTEQSTSDWLSMMSSDANGILRQTSKNKALRQESTLLIRYPTDHEGQRTGHNTQLLDVYFLRTSYEIDATAFIATLPEVLDVQSTFDTYIANQKLLATNEALSYKINLDHESFKRALKLSTDDFENILHSLPDGKENLNMNEKDVSVEKHVTFKEDDRREFVSEQLISLNELISTLTEQKISQFKDVLSDIGVNKTMFPSNTECFFLSNASSFFPCTDWPEEVAWLAQESGNESSRSLLRGRSDDLYLKGIVKPSPAATGSSFQKTCQEVLGLFESSGAAKLSDLDPINLISDRLYQNVKKENEVRDLPFSQAFHLIGHGLEYCVDSQNALRLDSRLAKVQSRFVPDDTMLLNSFLVRTFSGEKIEKRVVINAGTSSRRKGKIPMKRKPTKYAINEKVQDSSVEKSVSKSNTKESIQPNVGTSSSDALKPSKMKKTESKKDESSEKKMANESETESRSQRHKRRLRTIVEAVVEKHGKVEPTNEHFQACCDRLFALSLHFVKDLKTSNGLTDEMKSIAKGNVKQVVEFELRRK